MHEVVRTPTSRVPDDTGSLAKTCHRPLMNRGDAERSTIPARFLAPALRREGWRIAIGLGVTLALTASAARALPGTMRDRLPPGAPAWPAVDTNAVEAAWHAASASDADTGLRRPDGTPRFVNRLALATSPYLRLHAFNPVDWRPWGDAAFAEAKRLRRPVFLSIGYSTCHWCHVMAAESFEDEEIARLLNQRYVAIKVDREELPDVDATYLSALSALGVDGGWPANLWLTPEREPFFGGTYFAPRDGVRGQETGLLTLLRRYADAYAAHPEQVAGTSTSIASILRAELAATPPRVSAAIDDRHALDEAISFALRQLDPEHGGQQGAPKFPSDLPLGLLLRRAARDPSSPALTAVATTLRAMARGALQDQVGGGFHRYTVDEAWQRPHFEKTLYDNAQLAVLYLEAFQLTHDPEFADVARRTLDALARDFGTGDGAFAAASDADSAVVPGGERQEGRFFTWTRSELETALASLPSPRFLGLASGAAETRRPLVQLRAAANVTERDALRKERERLLEVRAARVPPARDDKEIVAWNGLAVSAFAQASWILDEPRYAELARRAATVFLEHRDAQGRLPRSVQTGRRRERASSRAPAVLDDYAALIAGLLDLYEATGEVRWFSAAQTLEATMTLRFEDRAHGGYYFTADDQPATLVRRSLWQDGAEPAGNSVAALDLLRLAAFTGNDAYRQRAERLLGAPGAALTTTSDGRSTLLLAADWRLDPPREIVLIAPNRREEVAPFLATLRAVFLPARVLSVHTEAQARAAAAVIPLLNGKRALGGRATAYVCRGFVCDRPTKDPAGFAAELSRPPATRTAGPRSRGR